MSLRSVTRTPPGLVLTEHELAVPLDHTAPDGERITVFAREVAEPEGRDKPFLVFFQGGPGFEAFRPAKPHERFLQRALQEFRVLLLDQRGTGRSSPVGTLAGMGPQEQADRLAHFRADAIVRDAEAFREALGVDRWSVLGQSFGGFCVTHYLSAAPGGLREALITGGIPPLGNRIDEVYARTWRLTLERVGRFYARYPDDRARVLALHRELQAPLGSARVRALGSGLGMSDGAEALHFLLELDPRSPAFAHDAATAGMGLARNPLYAVLHEASWADGGTTGWAAARTRPAAYDEDPALLAGEHVVPELLDEHASLTGLREAADLLAARAWPRLYDEAALAANEVPCAAAIYAYDMYVPRDLSEETAGRIRGMRPWITSEYDHDGLRADGDRILGHLLDLARGRV